MQRTVDINAIPTLRRDPSKIEADVDIDANLKLLESIALGVMGNESHAKRYSPPSYLDSRHPHSIPRLVFCSDARQALAQHTL